MYGRKHYALNLTVTESKNSKIVTTSTNARCMFGGFESLLSVQDFITDCKKVYKDAVKALQRGCRIELSFSCLVYEPLPYDVYINTIDEKVKLYQVWAFRGNMESDRVLISPDNSKKITSIVLKPLGTSDNFEFMSDAVLSSNTFYDIAHISIR